MRGIFTYFYLSRQSLLKKITIFFIFFIKGSALERKKPEFLGFKFDALQFVHAFYKVIKQRS
jgi:hypothetical protein